MASACFILELPSSPRCMPTTRMAVPSITTSAITAPRGSKAGNSMRCGLRTSMPFFTSSTLPCQPRLCSRMPKRTGM